VGTLTVRPLLLAQTPAHLLHLVRDLSSASLPHAQLHRLLPPVIRALRNILVSTADLVWGHMWGVGAERKVVDTGLVGLNSSSGLGKGKSVLGRGRTWTSEAVRALGLIFEVS
jgi:hypothetical protein